MARITQFATPEPRPDEGGAPAAAGEIASGIYKGVGSGLHDIGEALQRRGEQQETSQLHVGLANAQTQAFSDWENLKQNGDITDPETLQKFNEDFSNKISSLTDNITSPDVRNHANELIAEAQGGMVRRTLTDHAMAVGEQAQANYRQIVNDFSSLAASDPTFYEDGAKQIDMMVAASGLPSNKVPEAQLQARQELARSTIKGAGESLDPGYINQMVVELKTGRFDQDLNEDQKATQLKFLTARQEEADRVQKASKLLDKQQAEQVANSATSEYQQQLVDPKTNFLQWSHAILNDKRFDQNPEKRDSLINFGDRQINEPIRQKAQAEAQVRAEAAAGRAEIRFEEGERDRKIREAKADQGTLFNDTTKAISDGLYQSTDEIRALHLPLAQTNLLTRYFNSRQADKDKADGFNGQSKVFTEHYRGLITAPFGFPTVDGKASFYDAQQEVTQSEIAGRAKGLTAEQMFNSKSPDYIGGPYDRAVEAAKKAGIGGGLLDKDKTPIVISPHRAEVLKKYGLQ